jgi:CelD/BcsL family acetyltransferase involved in cellulose biosynthesis
VRIEHIDSEDGVAALVPEWAALWRRIPDATPFQSPLWLLAWWRQFGTGARRIVTARVDDSLVGVLPLYELRDPDCVKLLPIGISVSDYLDMLVDPAHRDVADALLVAITDIPGWRECHLPDLPPDAALAGGAAAPEGLRETRQLGPPCPVLTLPSDPAGLTTAVPHKTLRDVRQAHARSKAAGPVAFEAADRVTVDTAIEDLFRLHETRWRERGEAGVLASPAVRDFHREAARGFCEAGMLRLYRLRIAGALAGVYYGFHCNGKAYAYLGGFAPDMPRLSPGAQLLYHAICAAIDEGAQEFHFLRGGETYKYAWGAVDRFNSARTLRRP